MRFGIRQASFGIMMLSAASRLGAEQPDCRHSRAGVGDRAVANENRASSGTFRNDTLTLRLVMRAAVWYPEGPSGCALRVNAFAEEGRAAQIPGPLIRVNAGTNVRASVRNALPTSLWVRGLQDRDTGTLDSMEIAPGATRAFTFRATVHGAWYYWAGDVGAGIPTSGENGQLTGALVVDSLPRQIVAGERKAPNDRVLVLTRWTPTGTAGNTGFQLNAVNGRSWPHTERLTYAVGDSIRWHVINASDELHMMHLHGFYFRVSTRGDAAHDSALTRAQPPTVVTTAVRRGEWISAAWAAERAGNWLFHCHILTHMSADQRLDAAPGASVPAVAHSPDRRAAEAHGEHSMAGLVVGVTIRPGRASAHAAGNALARVRVLHVFANTRRGVFGDRPGYGFVLQDDTQQPARDSIRIPGSPLILTRGEPVAIVVHNRLSTPITVHWHGIELESFYDGVGGFSGLASRIAPMIAPGDSFVARMTPPRAGTFMYHVHNERGGELASGLYAPLIVVEPGRPFEPQTDRIFVIATGGPQADAPAFINGRAVADTATMTVGTTYRLRVIDISANEAHAVSMRGPGGLATWRVLARDGRDLPSSWSVMQAAQENTAAGVTRDFEFTPSTPGTFTLAATVILAGKPTSSVATVPIRVRAP